MKRTVFCVLAAMLLLGADAAIANQPGEGMFPNVSEHKIGFAAYTNVYEKLGTSRDVPKVIVYSSSGECVGVTDGKSIAASRLAGFITDSLRKHEKACDATISNQFGVSKPGPNAGTGKPEVYLIVFDVPFCTACNEFKTALLRASHGELADMRISVMSVALSHQK